MEYSDCVVGTSDDEDFVPYTYNTYTTNANSFATLNEDSTSLTIDRDYVTRDGNEMKIAITGDKWNNANLDEKMNILKEMGIFSNDDITEYKLKRLEL